jgi:hypothetical protein
MWVIGGYTGATVRTVYYSTDGVTWTQAGVDSLPVTTRSHTSVVYRGNMWVIGGWTGASYIRKVYSTVPEVSQGLVFDGSLSLKRSIASATPYNATSTDCYIGVTLTGATKTVNLPAVASVGIGRELTIKDESGDCASYNIIIDASGGELIDGSLTYTMNANYQSTTLICNGTSWSVV